MPCPTHRRSSSLSSSLPSFFIIVATFVLSFLSLLSFSLSPSFSSLSLPLLLSSSSSSSDLRLLFSPFLRLESLARVSKMLRSRKLRLRLWDASSFSGPAPLRPSAASAASASHSFPSFPSSSAFPLALAFSPALFALASPAFFLGLLRGETGFAGSGGTLMSSRLMPERSPRSSLSALLLFSSSCARRSLTFVVLLFDSTRR